MACAIGVGGATAGNNTVGPAGTKATLKVAITGLPTTAVASVAVTGPHGFHIRLTKTTIRNGLRPGRYTVAAAKVKIRANSYAPAVGSKHLSLEGGKRFAVTVIYRRVVLVLDPITPKPSTGAGTGSAGASTGTTVGAGAGGGNAGGGGGNAGGGGGGGGGGNAGGGGGGGGDVGGGASPGGGSASVPGVEFFLGYADTYRPSATGLPSPWAGSSGVTFVGCGNNAIANPGVDNCPRNAAGKDEYDDGAIRLVNTSNAAVTITAASVQIGNCTYHPWPGLSATIQAGNTLILAQTGGKSPCGDVDGPYNFDTSESDLSGTCVNDNLIPFITLAINGTTTTVMDTGQILNTGGFDKGDCPSGTSEYQNWIAVT